MVIDAPDEISVVGEYHFLLNDWAMKLEIAAPCNSTFINGVEKNVVRVDLDDEVTLTLQYEDDRKNSTWEFACGETVMRELIEAPNFVTYDVKHIMIHPLLS